MASDVDVVSRLDSVYDRVCAAERELFALIAEMDRAESWRLSEARDLAHWLSMRYGISLWKAHRWVAAANALESLPGLSDAFERGRLGVDKVVELARFATANDEAGLIEWAETVSCARIRRVGDLAFRPRGEELETTRKLNYWYFDDGARFGLEAELPAAQGAVVARAIERLAREIPVMPGEEGSMWAEARRADALVALASVAVAARPDLDRTTVVIHAPLAALAPDGPNGEVESGGVVPSETVRRLACNSRLQVVLEDDGGNPVHVGRLTREPPAWMLRQLRHRDRECRFPGCGMRAFTQAHHVVWWSAGGTTDLENLVLTCSFHHRLVHEHGWSLSRTPDNSVRWFRPDGTRYLPGPAPPGRATDNVRPPTRAAPATVAGSLPGVAPIARNPVRATLGRS
ncbi:MAG: DUF222 domain-containing protein [Actinomycetota bacterium]